MMKALLLSAMVFGPCLGSSSKERHAEDLEAGPEEAPEDSIPVAQPGTQVSMTVSGRVENYAADYWTTTFFNGIRAATNAGPNVQFYFNSATEGSVIVLFTLHGAELATLQTLAQEIVRQANDPNSPLRTVHLTNVLGAVVANPHVVTIVPRGDDDGLSDGAIAGIVVGSLVFVVGVAVLIYCFACKEDESAGGQADSKPSGPYGIGADAEVENQDQEQVMEAKPGEDAPQKDGEV